MQHYAQLEPGEINSVRRVKHVTESAVDPDGTNGEWVICDGSVSTGSTSVDGGLTFSPPVAAALPVRYLSKLGFRNRFTSAEKATIEFAAVDNPAAGMPARMLAASIRASLADQRDAKFIDPARPDTRQGVIDMEAGGLLAPGRALEILDSPVEDHEAY